MSLNHYHCSYSLPTALRAQENNRLKSQFKSQEEDREFLIKQLVAVKKDNAKIRGEYVALEEEKGHLRLSDRQESTGNAATAAADGPRRSSVVAKPPSTERAVPALADPDMDDRYQEINKRLRRLLAEERKSLQQVRQNYALELSVRTEMELLLRKCVEDVRKEIARRKIEAASMAGSDLVKLYSR